MIDFFDAINETNLEVLKMILKENPTRANEISDIGQTPLNFALREGHHEVAQLLLSSGADVNAMDEWGNLPLHEAVSGKDIQLATVELLIKSGANINAKIEMWDSQVTPLGVLAIEKINNPENSIINVIASFLIRSGALFLNVPTAAVFGTVEDVNELLNNGADINTSYYQGMCGLHIAAKLSNVSLAQFLLDRGAYIDDRDDNCHRPLDYASSPEMIDLLRQHGAHTDDEIESMINDDLTELRRVQEGHYYGEALLKAAQTGDLNKVKEIITLPVEKGGLLLLRYLARNHEGKSPLQLAAENGYSEIVEFLLSHGMRVPVEDLSKNTPKGIKKLIENYENK